MSGCCNGVFGICSAKVRMLIYWICKSPAWSAGFSHAEPGGICVSFLVCVDDRLCIK